MGKLIIPTLWDEASLPPPATKIDREKETVKKGSIHAQMCHVVNFTRKYEMPKIKAVHKAPPAEIMGFNRAKLSNNKHICPHCFINDELFSILWTQPRRYINYITSVDAIIDTDFSVYEDMPLIQKEFNTYRNHLLAAWWQYLGAIVIPNVSWFDINAIEFSISGLPKFSTIAINSTGLGRSNQARARWLECYSAVIQLLAPERIIRYGAKIPGEHTEISYYYQNDNLKSVNNGRQ